MRKKEIRDLIRRKGRKQQPWPLYTCQLLKLEEKHKFSNLEYSFDVTKANKIFDVLLKDKQIALSDDHKIPFEQRKGKRYCKFPNIYFWTLD